MLETLRIQNFKSWKDTGTIQFGALTGFFGTNSSGKTSILQFLLMLKQTVESSDRSRILDLGDENSYVDLGTMQDIIHNHDNPGNLNFDISWLHKEPFYIANFLNFTVKPIQPTVAFSSSIKYEDDIITLESFRYFITDNEIGISKNAHPKGSIPNYEFTGDGPQFLSFKSTKRHSLILQSPKFYGFPSAVYNDFLNTEILGDLVNGLEKAFYETFYLGPLRAYPKRLYTWAGGQTSGVGNSGEYAVAAMLSSRQRGITIILDDKTRHSLEEHIAYWLKELGLIHSFAVRPIAPNRKEYEVRVRKTADAPEVFITDVGFGVSQLLPVLVLLFYVPEGSTIILEQPEIHLHPAVQAGLADVILDAIKRRNVQIILESHSEHLLQRLQTRIAENKVVSADQVKLYFTKFEKEASEMEQLKLDEYGNILNWPRNFFGDSFGEAANRMREEIKRRQAAGEE
jgi:predicted ATPase